LLAKDIWNISLGPMRARTKTKYGTRDILWDEDAYTYLVDKNKRDTEVCEWTKTQACLDWSRVPRNESRRW